MSKNQEGKKTRKSSEVAIAGQKCKFDNKMGGVSGHGSVGAVRNGTMLLHRQKQEPYATLK